MCIYAEVLLLWTLGHSTWYSLSEPHTSVVYGNTCINRPTNWPTNRPTMSVPFTWCGYIARAHAGSPYNIGHATLGLMCAWWWTVQCVVVIAIRPRTLTTGKQKLRHPRNELRGWNERETSEPLHTCASLSVSPCILGFHVRQFFSPVTSHKPFFTLSYISTTCVHCILDKTYAHIMHTGVHRPLPLA